jgi:hypothetical protein
MRFIAGFVNVYLFETLFSDSARSENSAEDSTSEMSLVALVLNLSKQGGDITSESSNLYSLTRTQSMPVIIHTSMFPNQYHLLAPLLDPSVARVPSGPANRHWTVELPNHRITQGTDRFSLTLLNSVNLVLSQELSDTGNRFRREMHAVRPFPQIGTTHAPQRDRFPLDQDYILELTERRMREERTAAVLLELLRVVRQQCRRPGKPYKNYDRDKKQREVILPTLFPDWTRQSSKIVIRRRFGVLKRTCYHWKEQWEENHSWPR